MDRDRKDQETKTKANKVIGLASSNTTAQLLHAGTVLATARSSSCTKLHLAHTPTGQRSHYHCQNPQFGSRIPSRILGIDIRLRSLCSPSSASSWFSELSATQCLLGSIGMVRYHAIGHFRRRIVGLY